MAQGSRPTTGMTVGNLMDILQKNIEAGVITKDAYLEIPKDDNSPSLVVVRGLKSVHFVPRHTYDTSMDHGAVFLAPVKWNDPHG